MPGQDIPYTAAFSLRRGFALGSTRVWLLETAVTCVVYRAPEAARDT